MNLNHYFCICSHCHRLGLCTLLLPIVYVTPTAVSSFLAGESEIFPVFSSIVVATVIAVWDGAITLCCFLFLLAAGFFGETEEVLT